MLITERLYFIALLYFSYKEKLIEDIFYKKILIIFLIEFFLTLLGAFLLKVVIGRIVLFLRFADAVFLARLYTNKNLSLLVKIQILSYCIVKSYYTFVTVGWWDFDKFLIE